MGRSGHGSSSTFPADHDPTRQFLPSVTPGDEELGVLSGHPALSTQPLASPSDSVLSTPCFGPGAFGGLDAGVLSTMPGDVVHAPLISPPYFEGSVQHPANPLVGGPLAVIPSTLPPTAPPAAKEGPGGMRLPSFQQLGIAAPHPDRMVSPVLRDESPVLSSFGGLDIGSGGGLDSSPPKSDGGRAVQSPVYHFINTLTPPIESGPTDWNPQPTVQTAGMHSPPAPAGNESEQTVDVPVTGQAEGAVTTVPDHVDAASSGHTGSGEQRPWMDDAVDNLCELPCFSESHLAAI